MTERTGIGDLRSEHVVLIVDDDLEFIEDFTKIFERRGDTACVLAYSAAGAIKNLKLIEEGGNQVPGLIFVDLHMEDDFSGYKVLQFVRKTRKLEHISVIMVSHSTYSKDIEQAYEMEVNSYVHKPVNLRALRNMLGTISEYWCGFNLLSGMMFSTNTETLSQRSHVIMSDEGESFEIVRLPNFFTYRNSARISIAKLSRLSGVSQSEVSRADNGEGIRVGDMNKLIRVIGPRLSKNVDLENEVVKKLDREIRRQ